MNSTPCDLIAARPLDVLEGAPGTEALVVHAEGCGACAALLGAHASLETALLCLPEAPSGAADGLPAPRLPARAPGRPIRRLLVQAAAAAALLVAVALVSAWPRGTDAPERDVADRTDAADKVAVLVDERDAEDHLLALVAGTEAVAMRRPAESR